MQTHVTSAECNDDDPEEESHGAHVLSFCPFLRFLGFPIAGHNDIPFDQRTTTDGTGRRLRSPSLSLDPLIDTLGTERVTALLARSIADGLFADWTGAADHDADRRMNAVTSLKKERCHVAC